MSRFLDKQVVHETHRGRSDRVEELLAKRADINRLASDGFTPLMRAAYHGHHDLVRILLEHGADPNATPKDGASERSNRPELVSLMKRRGRRLMRLPY